jgi:dihydroflavonol-4-reductase
MSEEQNLGRVLVTGATGIVGWNIVKELRAQAYEVRVLVRDEQRARTVLPADIEYVTGDLRNTGDVDRAVQGCDTVFHAAGLPEQWLRDPTQFHTVNVGGTEALCAAALNAGVSAFVHTSTISVFARQGGIPFDTSALAAEPLGTAYDRSKQLADRAVVDALSEGLPARFVHPAGIYGPSPSPTPGINDFVKRIATNRMPALPPGGLPVVHARDLAVGSIRAATAPIGERYIFSDRYITLRELADLVCSLTPAARRPPSLPPYLAAPISRATELAARITNRPPLLPAGQLHFLQSHSIPDASHARTDLGWKPTPLRDGLIQTLDHLRAT